MAATSVARAVWDGPLATGSGTVGGNSKAFADLPVSWPARTDGGTAKTTPEELLASAHASCFAMALSGGLGRAGTPPQKLTVTASVVFDKVGDAWTVVSSSLEVSGVVPGIDAAGFAKAADAAKDGCPISRALKGNVQLSVRATLA